MRSIRIAYVLSHKGKRLGVWFAVDADLALTECAHDTGISYWDLDCQEIDSEE